GKYSRQCIALHRFQGCSAGTERPHRPAPVQLPSHLPRQANAHAENALRLQIQLQANHRPRPPARARRGWTYRSLFCAASAYSQRFAALILARNFFLTGQPFFFSILGSSPIPQKSLHVQPSGRSSNSTVGGQGTSGILSDPRAASCSLLSIRITNKPFNSDSAIMTMRPTLVRLKRPSDNHARIVHGLTAPRRLDADSTECNVSNANQYVLRHRYQALLARMECRWRRRCSHPGIASTSAESSRGRWSRPCTRLSFLRACRDWSSPARYTCTGRLLRFSEAGTPASCAVHDRELLLGALRLRPASLCAPVPPAN